MVAATPSMWPAPVTKRRVCALCPDCVILECLLRCLNDAIARCSPPPQVRLKGPENDPETRLQPGRAQWRQGAWRGLWLCRAERPADGAGGACLSAGFADQQLCLLPRHAHPRPPQEGREDREASAVASLGRGRQSFQQD